MIDEELQAAINQVREMLDGYIKRGCISEDMWLDPDPTNRLLLQFAYTIMCLPTREEEEDD